MKSLCKAESPVLAVSPFGVRAGVLLVSMIFMNFAATAENNSADTQTVERLIERALEYNAELVMYQASLEAAKGQRVQTSRWKNPQLELEGGYRRVKELTGNRDLEKGYTFGIALTQTFEFPGKASLRKAIAQRDTRIAELGLAQFRLSLSGKIRQLAARYQSAVDLENITLQISERSAGLVALLKERPLAGSKPLLEMMAIQASQTELTEIAKEAVITRNQAQAELNRLLGYPSTRSIDIPSEAIISQYPELPSLEEWLRICLTQNLQLKIREAELDRSRLSLDAEKLASAPDFEIGPFFSQEATGAERETTIGASVAMELPMWNQNQGNIASARALEEMAQAQLIMAQRKLEHELTTRWIVYQANLKQVNQFDPAIRSELQAVAALADRQYRQGVIDVQLYLESQRALINTIKIYNDTHLQLGDALLDLELLSGGGFSSNTIKETQP